MSRFITSLILFCFFLGSSFYILYFRPKAQETHRGEGAQGSPTIEAENIQIKKYKGLDLVLNLRADNGLVLGTKKVLLNGHVRVQRPQEKVAQDIRSQRALFYFVAASLEDFWKEHSFTRARFSGEVQVSLGAGETLETSVVKYDKMGESFSGDRPTVFKGPTYQMKTENGFYYQAKSQLLQVVGYVEGSSLF